MSGAGEVHTPERSQKLKEEQTKRNSAFKENLNTRLEQFAQEERETKARFEANKPDVAARKQEVRDEQAKRDKAFAEKREAAVQKYFQDLEEAAPAREQQRREMTESIAARTKASHEARVEKDNAFKADRDQRVKEYVTSEDAASAKGKSDEEKEALRDQFRAKSRADALKRRQKYAEEQRAKWAASLTSGAETYYKNKAAAPAPSRPRRSTPDSVAGSNNEGKGAELKKDGGASQEAAVPAHIASQRALPIFMSRGVPVRERAEPAVDAAAAKKEAQTAPTKIAARNAEKRDARAARDAKFKEDYASTLRAFLEEESVREEESAAFSMKIVTDLKDKFNADADARKARDEKQAAARQENLASFLAREKNDLAQEKDANAQKITEIQTRLRDLDAKRRAMDAKFREARAAAAAAH
ncbi:Hypothetical Protein FCC1311_080582 [Hondaea fermentalgiana]|uniref:Uncharacterized protein n=1 Tax=Hondaea fermentalgiana TaxID=2315210 RepID=A0A2R5GT54_9STRA|nr:Hypothetical Protein FCC1311_080582 [Hondaea fermentalgiana]|eukprot:GBG31833.1 Hypothetical Protein FCC1311_080582 [Hondaea fermentalgiana]